MNPIFSNQGKSKKILFLSWFLWFAVYAQDTGKWVRCVGEAVIGNITAEEAYGLALKRARQDAVEKACGLLLQSETLIRNFTTAGDFIHTISHGWVVEERDTSWETVSLPSDRPDRPPSVLVRVSLNARVMCEAETPDPDFRVSLEMNKLDYFSGDEAIFTIRATQDCYVTVLNLAANDSVYVLFPNPFQKNNFVRAGETIRIPDERFKIRVKTLPGRETVSEVIQVIGTKRKVTFFEETDMPLKPGSVGTPKMAIVKLARVLSEIPMSERTQVAKLYTVRNNK